MSDVEPPPPLRINLHDQPASVVLTQRINIFLYLCFSWTPTRIIWEIGIALVVLILVLEPLRDERAWFGQLIAFVVGASAYAALAYLQIRLARGSVISRLFSGPWRFANLHLGRTRDLRFIGSCLENLQFEFDSESARLMELVRQKDHAEIRYLFEREYQRVFGNQPGREAMWADVNAARISKSTTFGQALESGRYSLFTGRQLALGSTLGVIPLIYITTFVWVFSDAERNDYLATLLRLTLLAGVIIASVVFANFTASFRKLEFTDPEMMPFTDQQMFLMSPEVKEYLFGLRNALRQDVIYEELRNATGREVYPRLTIKPGYIRAIRNAYVLSAALRLCFPAIVYLVLLLLSWLAALALSPWPNETLSDWGMSLAFGIVIAPMALAGSLTLAFFILEQSRRFASIFTAGVLVSIVPLILAEAVGTEQSSSQTLVAAVATAVAGTLPMTIAEMTKRRPSGTSPEATSPDAT